VVAVEDAKDVVVVVAMEVVVHVKAVVEDVVAAGEFTGVCWFLKVMDDTVAIYYKNYTLCTVH
jgi:hypothetical protein